MASNPDNGPPAKQFVDYDEYVDFQIEKARSHIKATDVFTTLTTLIAAFVGYLLLFVVFDQWVFENGFGDWARSALLAVVLVGIGTVLVRSVVLPLIRRVHPLYAARMIERSDPKLKSNLLNFVDVQQSDGTAAAPVVLRAMQKRAAVELSHIDVDEAIDRRPLLRVAYALLAIVVASALYIVFSPKDPFTSVRRALLPTASIAVATETTIDDVTPGDDRVPARTQLTVEADVRGHAADRVQILFTTSDHKEVDQPVEMRRIDPDLPRFRGVLNGENGRGLLQGLTYSIVAGDARTRDFRIDVMLPPSARVEEVHCDFPAYMQFDGRTTPGGAIDAWEGAVVTVRATANMPVKSAAIVMTDNEDPHAKGEEIGMQVSDGTKLTANWKLEFRSDGTCPHFYHVQIKSAKGEVDPEPTVFPLRIRPDQRPDVALLSPTADLTGERARPANAIVPLVIQAADPDFQLRSIRLRAERNGDELVNEPLFEERHLGQSFRGHHDWNLGALRPNLRPGETIQFWIEARDNKQPTPNRAVTPRLNLEVLPEKSAEEVRKELAAEKKEQEDQLARADETKNDGGSDPQPRETTDDGANAPPPERTETGDPNRVDEKTSPAEDKEAGDNRTPDAKSAPTAGGEQKGQPPQPGSDPQKALERLLQKQNEEQADPSDPGEKREQQPPAQGEKAEREKSEGGDKAGAKNQKGMKKGTEKSGSGADRPDDNAPRQPDRPEGKSGSKNPKPQPDAKGDKQPGDSKAGKQKKPGDAPSKADEGDASDPPPNTEKPRDAKKDSPGTKPAEKPQDGNAPPDKKSPEKKPDEKKSGQKKSDGTEPGVDRPGDGDANEPNGSEKISDEPNKSAERSPTDRDNPPKPDDRKTPKQKDQPNSDGGTSDDNPSQGDDAKTGKPAGSKSKTGAEQPGDASDRDNSSDSKGTRRKQENSPDLEGDEEPAEDDPAAKKRQATGNESGEATGSDEDDPNAAKNNAAKRKPDSNAGKMKPSESKNQDPDTNRPAERRKADDATSSRTDDAAKVRRPPEGKKPTEQPGPVDDPASEKPEKSPNANREKRPEQPPDAGNQDLKGRGRKGGQKSDQPESGEKGESSASDQGEPGSNEQGAGDKGDQPGDSEKADGKTGAGGKKPGQGSRSKASDSGSKSKSGEGGKSDQAGKKGGGEGKGEGKGKGDSSDSKGSGSSGEGGKKPGSQVDGTSSSPTGGNSKSPVGGGVTGPPSGDGASPDDGSGDGDRADQSGSSGDSVPSEDEEQARLDYARKATNLLLNRLKDQLSRGEIDQKLLDEMGWKDAGDVANFARYLEDNLRNTSDETKRLQFEEMLKSLRLGKETIRRQGGGGVERRTDNATRLVPVPPEWRERYENYNKRLSNRPKAGDGKPTSPDKKK